MSIPGLTREEVLTIRALYAEGITQWTLAHQFHTPQGTISKIVNGTTYRQVGMPVTKRVCHDCKTPMTGRKLRCAPCLKAWQHHTFQKWYARRKEKETNA